MSPSGLKFSNEFQRDILHRNLRTVLTFYLEFNVMLPMHFNMVPA